MRTFLASVLSLQVALSGFGQWTMNSPPTIQNINDCWVTTDNRIITAGDGGVIFFTDDCGENWNLALNPILGDDVQGLFFYDELLGFAAVENGKVLKTIDGGSTWTFFQSPASNDLEALYFTSQNTGYAAGRDGNLVKTTNGGLNWSSQSSGTIERLEDLWFFDGNNGFVVGRGSTLLQTENGGATWFSVSTGIPGDLYGIHFTDANNGYIASEFGVYKSTDGGLNWFNTGAAVTQWNDLYMFDTLNGYAVGIFGQFISTSDAGVTWNTEASGTVNELFAIHQNGTSFGYLSGELGVGLSKCAVACLGDFNADLQVNTQDLLLFLGSFGCLTNCGIVDMNQDGIVNTQDLLNFLGVFGIACG